jgi:hypothetical protein
VAGCTIDGTAHEKPPSNDRLTTMLDDGLICSGSCPVLLRKSAVTALK